MAENKTTLESLKQQQKILQHELIRCERRITNHWNFLFTPPQPNTKIEALVAHAERAYAVYDGVMLGYKLFRRLNHAMGFMQRNAKKQHK